ncbi:hypothetical protein GSI_04532 [Ganoderma sinense ZZ0214-1]|uniref:DUF6697 domain-containing protein n=1 Tax=Ganoderma sinense ZZ0214-1 TaxID=1077348 RepID=A0A2G8SH53_9APHY|nr:hypothetical protein GSI_04532 [Ganoderma sinense ZZ0214-1]
MAIRLERLRVREALNARDVAVERLAGACASVREKAAALEVLREEKEALQRRFDAALAKRECSGVEKENGETGAEGKGEGATDIRRQLASCVKTIEDRLASLKIMEDSASGVVAIDEIESDYKTIKQRLETTFGAAFKGPHDTHPAPPGMLRDLSNATMTGPALLPSPLTAPGTPRDVDAPESPWTPLEGERAVALPTVSTAEKIEARYAILASLPLPSGIPEDSLTPILIPTPYTLHDFVGTTSGLLRSQLGNYRVFQQSTTTWCPEREEHGYFLTPVFKCSTNPRVNTAHRWTVADISGKLDKPTECFYNKDGKWYYAGIYKSFRLDDLCPQEWDCLSQETSQALIKETLVGRKNTSPQNVYEVGQLYSVGALKVACIGLQCIGFNTTLYRSLLEHAALCTQTGKWRAAAGGFNVNVNANTGHGLGSGASTPWSGGNVSVHATPSGPGSPATMGSVSSALATGGMVPQAGGGGALQAGVLAPGTAPGGRSFGPVTVSGPGLGLGSSPGPGIGIGLGLGSRQLLSTTSGMRISQHGPEDIAGTPGFRPLGKM